MLWADPFNGRERVAALPVRTARNRRTRTRMSGGVGGGGRNPPADPIELSRFAAGGGAALRGGVPVSAIERALDCPARFGHTWLGSGIWPHGHSSQPIAATQDKKEKAREAPGLVQLPIASRLRTITSWLYPIIFGALRSMLSLFVRPMVSHAIILALEKLPRPSANPRP